MNYIVITRKDTKAGLNWVLDAKKPLSDSDMDFIKTFSPVTFWNDSDGRNWAFDEKMPSGRYLENMKFTEDGTTVKAKVL